MNKRRLLCMTALSCGIMLTGCSVESPEQDIQVKDAKQHIVIHANIASDSDKTKTSLGVDGKVYWEPMDEISVFRFEDSDIGAFTSTNTELSTSTDFEGDLAVSSGDGIVAVYPSVKIKSVTEQDGIEVTVFDPTSCWTNYDSGSLASEQKAIPGNFDRESALMAADGVVKNNEVDLHFCNVPSGLKFTVAEEGLLRVKLKGNNNESVAGKFFLFFQPVDDGLSVTGPEPTSPKDGYDIPIAEPDQEKGSKEIILAPESGSFVVGEWYYLTVLPQTLTKGMTLTFVYAGGKEKELVMENALTFKRNVWKKAANLDSKAVVTKGIEAVDLGLSVKWASCNVGASSPEEYGDYFAWGETESKEQYYYYTYKYCKTNSQYLIKYCTYSGQGDVDNKTMLESEDDAATVNIGPKWRTPTTSEWQELLDNCTFTRQNHGYLVTSKKNGYTDKSIFLPPTGYKKASGTVGVGYNAMYWSSELLKTSSSYNPQKASAVAWGSSDRIYFLDQKNERWNGAPVRAVCSK